MPGAAGKSEGNPDWFCGIAPTAIHAGGIHRVVHFAVTARSNQSKTARTQGNQNQQATGYNLHMTFAIGPENKYVPDVQVAIQKAQGPTVLTLSEAGPLVYVQLPPGKYTVIATRNGEERRDTADVGSGAARNLVFHWNSAE